MSVDLTRLAHARALMLGSSEFPPAAHLDYLRSRESETLGPGLGRVDVEDLVLRDIRLPAERTEVIRVVAETLIAFGQVGVQLDPASVRAVPPSLVAAQLAWFGLERAGRLVGLHGGFFWNEGLWIRRFYGVLEDLAPELHGEIEAAIYDHLRARGLREAMIQLPVDTPNLAARRAAGWADSHEVHFSGNRRPFMWLRRSFRPRRSVPDFASRWGPVSVREGTWRDLVAIRDERLGAWWATSPEHRGRVAKSIPHLWGMESASLLLGDVDGVPTYGYLIREATDDAAAAVISSLHPPGVHQSAASFYYAAMAWMAAAGYATYRAYLRPDCSGRNALAHDCLAQGGTLTWVPAFGKVLTSYPLATLLAQPLEAYVPHWQALVAADQSDAALPPEFPAEALAWARAHREVPV